MNEYILKNVILLDGTMNMNEVKTSILIKNNKIEKIGDNITGNYKIYDLDGKYVIPGLINLHVHLPGSGIVHKKQVDSKKLVKIITTHKLLRFVGYKIEKKNARIELNSGVTTLRSVGGIDTFDTELRDKINSGKVIGPRILASNYALAPIDGHMLGTVSKLVRNKEEAISLVEELNKSNVDLIKLMITGGVIDAVKLGEPGVLKMSKEIVEASVTKAHELGLKVSAHTESIEGVRLALECGVDTIEHGSNFDSEIISLFKENNSSLILTITPGAIVSLLDPKVTNLTEFIRYNSVVVAKNIFDGLKLALSENINIGLGNDVGCPYVFHYDFYRELEWFAKSMKVDRKYVLYIATLNNAKIINLDKEIGSIEEGKLADLLVVDKNPLDSFSNLKSPFMVIKDGKIIKRHKNKIDKKASAMLDSLFDIDIDKEFEKYFTLHPNGE